MSSDRQFHLAHKLSGTQIVFPAPSHLLLSQSQLSSLTCILHGIGVIVYWVIPAIDKQTTLFRLLIGGIFLGGIGRLSSALSVGIPPIQFIAVIVLELIGMPLLILWQSSILKLDSLTEPLAIQETLK